jgi:hypothetical protein
MEEAMRQLADAPRTETGIIVPPHVAEQLRAPVVLDEAVGAKPNRAQRRAMERAQRRQGRKPRQATAAPQTAVGELGEAARSMGADEVEAAVRAELARRESTNG